jgi:hypothetical protein
VRRISPSAAMGFAHLGSGKTGWFAGLTIDTGLTLDTGSPPASPLDDGDASASPLWSKDECYRLDHRLALARSNAGANRRVANPPAVSSLPGAGKHMGEKTPSGQR